MDTNRKPFPQRGVLIAVLIVLTAAALIVVKFAFPNLINPTGGTPMPTRIVDSSGGGQNLLAGEPFNLRVSLGQGTAPVEATTTPLPVQAGEPLSQSEIDAIFTRLPDLPVEPGDQVVFHYPVELLPPPRPGTVIQDKFPPESTLPAPDVEPSKPLEVLRYAPEGEIPIAPFVSITFNQPMIPLGTLSDLKSQEVPVKIEPSLPGTWRWLGTNTLTFEYDSTLIDRLPKATSYRVTVPAGIKSVSGEALEKEVTWTFTTPAPVLTSKYPEGIPQPLDPLIFLEFDQRIDPAAVLKTIRLYAGGTPYDVVLASEDEIKANETISNLTKNAQDGRWMVFKAVESFPAATTISITVGPGTPSAEGPAVTSTAQSFSFSTYAPLRVEDHGCYYGNNQCPPGASFYIRFNNPLDESIDPETMIKVNPELPGMAVNLYGDSIVLSGQSSPQTTYTVTVSAAIMDTFGQRLGEDVPLTYQVGSAEPNLTGPRKQLVTLDPTSKQANLTLYVINYQKLVVKIYAVQPSDWGAFTNYYRQWQQRGITIDLPGKLVFDQTINLDIPSDKLSEVDIKLTPYLKNGYGHFIVKVEPPSGMFTSQEDKYKRFYQSVLSWVQVTQIGIDAYTDQTDMIVWATNLRDGSPLSGVTLHPDKGGPDFTTTSDGTARIAIPAGATTLTATLGNDTALLPHSPYGWDDGGWTASAPRDSLRWFIFDDRQMYQPGEEVHLKGWLRRIGNGQTGDVSLVGNSVRSVDYKVTDPQGNPISDGSVDVNSLGGFDFSFTIPEVVNLGYAQVLLTIQGTLSGVDGMNQSHSFQIQEFRRPEFEVTAKNESSGPYFAGGSALLSVTAKYYSGGPLPNAGVDWTVTTRPGKYSPPNWPDFIFGEWTPWWTRSIAMDSPWQTQDEESQTYTGVTDAAGMHFLDLKFDQSGDPGKDPQPMSIEAQAVVEDVNRQAWAGSTTLLVHPAALYVGLRSERYFVERGTPIKVEFIVTDLDGAASPDRPVNITAARLEWKYRGGKWTEVEVDPQECKSTSKQEPQTCSFDTPVGGSYRITARVSDDLGRVNQTRFTRWVSGAERAPSRTVDQEEVTLVPDKESYAPGDTAQILVQSPFTPAEGLLTVSRSGFVFTTRFQLKKGSTTLSIPIKEEYIPNLNIQVDLVGEADRTDDQGNVLKNAAPRPAFATASLSLSIPPAQRTLSLNVDPEVTRLEPGGETTLHLVVRDANGQPVPNAELAAVVVDEAVLALTDYQMQDPLSIFYNNRGSGVFSLYARSSIVLANPLQMANQIEGDTGFGGAAAPAAMATPMVMYSRSMTEDSLKSAPSQSTPITLRANFNPLATFAPAVHTDAQGNASVAIKLPDNLTRYRIMVVAVDESGKRFGTGESNLTARLPLMVRPSAPRFLNFGDRFELPVILQNQTDTTLEVEVIARATNLELAHPGFKVTIPANDRTEVRFPASTVMAGTARVQIAAVSGTYADAAVVEIPVNTPATTEAFATYGVIDSGAVAQPILSPSDVFSQFGGLEISTSSTALQTLTDAVIYLVKYPFECTEQLASRVMAISALRDVMTSFHAEGLPAPAELESSVNSDIQVLQSLQNPDGGFPYWRRGFESIPFNTIHVSHALYRASEKGFAVPEEMKQSSLAYLRNIEDHYPAWYTKETRQTLSAYALYVRNLWGDHDPSKAYRLITEAGLENLSMEAIGWLWSVVDNETHLEAIQRYVTNHIVETAGAANFTTNYTDQTYLLLSSDRRTDAILLDAIMEKDPQSDLVVKVVKGLLAHRTKGRWENTQENVFVLLAMDRYFNTYEAQTPDFVARFWLGDTYAGADEYRGRTTDIHETLIPMAEVIAKTGAENQTANIILSKEGTGRMYYRLGLSYAPTDLDLNALDAGFVVQREYEAMDDPSDVTRDNDGTWHIKAGARVKVHITLVATNRRYHVALVDPLPAGLEIINPALAVSQDVPKEDPAAMNYGWWWWRPWYEHQNLRDDRAEAFSTLLWDGVYEYNYYTRATTPGTFIVPPTKAEEMYSPEVFGRSSSDRVIVE